MFLHILKNVPKIADVSAVRFSSAISSNSKGDKQSSLKSRLDLSTEREALYSAYSTMHDDLLDEQLIYHKSNQDIRDRYSRLIDYNLNLEPTYLARALFSIHAYRLIEKPSLMTPEKLKKAALLGWCHKLIDASINLDDDITDESAIRHGKPTWYSLKDIGTSAAIFDAAFLESGAYFLLLKHLSSHPHFLNIAKEILQFYSVTNLGQEIEARRYSLEKMEENQNFVKAYYFTVPIVRCALYLAGVNDKDSHKASEEICIDIARYMKIEDDVTCVFTNKLDKGCTDVSEGKSSWLAIEAYKRATPIQKKLMEEHYGKNNNASVQKIYNLFKEFRLDELFQNYKQEFYDNEVYKIKNKLPKSLPPQVFLDLLDYTIDGQYRV